VPTPLKISLATSSRCAIQCRVHLPWGLIVNHPTLSYKRLGWTPLPRGRKKKRLRQDRLEHNTTQISHGHMVLRSGDLNHVNHRVPRVQRKLTTKMLKAFPAKKNNSGLLLSGSGENVTKPLRQLISSSGLGGAFFFCPIFHFSSHMQGN
jgi:hypothetical protein